MYCYPVPVLIGPCGIETRNPDKAILCKEVLIGPCGIETTQKLRIRQGWSVLIGPCGIETSFRKECDSVFYKY